jgi:oxygen-independent coproporphyrinogen-3 oxidase
MPVMREAALYVHIPFCVAKCKYCSFNSYAGLDHLHEAYLEALENEVSLSTQERGQFEVPSVYIGGGTPTVLGPELLSRVVQACKDHFLLHAEAEITVEANPGTVDATDLSRIRKIGVNRLSLGVQSFNDGLLALLGRVHDADDAESAYRLARQTGFDNVNLDLIYGLPGQSLEQWEADLCKATALSPEHLSLYCLTLDEETALARSISEGNVPVPDADLAAEMYEMAEVEMARAGYVHYEISNWAATGHECRHNLVYWHNHPYLGFGAGAHSFDGAFRFYNVLSPQEYVQRMARVGEAIGGCEEINRATQMSETMILGLRLLEGVSYTDFQVRFSVTPEQVFADQIKELTDLDLLELNRGAVRLTDRGHLLGNEVFERFLPVRAS